MKMLRVGLLAILLLRPTIAPARAPATGFHVPEGFVIERAVDERRVIYPMFAAFDDRGRLYVAESSGGDLYAELTALKKNCRVTLLEDGDGDGHFESSHVFADRLVMPMGLVWRDGKLYLAQGPEAVTLQDVDGDGRADKRTVVLSGFGHSDNGGLHGLIFGPDGLLYMTVGQPDGYRFRDAAGVEVWGKTGALIRCHPDGTHPEVLCRGFENLVEIVFLPSGEMIGTDNWFQLPAGGVRDALVHLVEGGKYPHMADNGSPLLVTGDDLPAIAKFPAVALSGLAQYRGTAFPENVRGNLFSAHFNTRRIQRHVLARDGATFRSENVDFVTSDDPDFHPSDVLESPDGSVLIVDTGGWYVQHCPTGKIRDSYAPGGIYRVRYTGADRSKNGLITNLEALWSASPQELRAKLDSDDTDTAALAARVLAVRRDRGAAAALARLLKADAPHVRLAAAEALARCGSPETVPALWEALAATSDRFLQHALIHAALHVAGNDALHSALASPNASVQIAALLLLDQPPRRTLTYAELESHLASSNESVRAVAVQILRKHSEWAAEATTLARTLAHQGTLTDAEAERLRSLVLAFHTHREMQQLVTTLLDSFELPSVRRSVLIDTLTDIPIGELPNVWTEALGKQIAAADLTLRRAAVHAIAVLQLPQFDDQLAKLAEDASQPDAIRWDAVRAIVSRRRMLAPAVFTFLTDQLAPRNDPANRLAASQLLARAKLTDAQQSKLRLVVGTDPLVGPLLFPQAARATEEERALLGGYEAVLKGGNPAHGRELFFGKVLCGSCHQVGSDGARIGPDLTKIGAVRSRHDLLESIVLPSATFAQGYEPYVVTTTEGVSLVGMLTRQTADVLVMRDVAGNEQRVARAKVRAMERAPNSLMPAGLDRALTVEEFRDLMAYLESLR